MTRAPSTDGVMHITRDGVWHYRGTPIRREAMVRLFAGLLQRDADGGFYLVTKFERCRVNVDDAPFIAVDLNIHGHGRKQQLNFTTNIGDTITANHTHPLRITTDPTGNPTPYLTVRKNLEARLTPTVFYQLAEAAEQRAGRWFVYSDGVEFVVG